MPDFDAICGQRKYGGRCMLSLYHGGDCIYEVVDDCMCKSATEINPYCPHHGETVPTFYCDPRDYWDAQRGDGDDGVVADGG